MDELSNKYTYDAKYQEERNTPIKTLMELHLQNNVISYTLKYADMGLNDDDKKILLLLESKIITQS